MQHLLSHTLHHDEDMVTARQRAAQIAALLGFDVPQQTRIATATSEIVRNAFKYTGGGKVDFSVDTDARPQRFVVEVRDHGRGIPQLDDVLAGRFRSATGMGIGIVGARRLMDGFAIESSPAGTTVVLEKFIPAHADAITAEQAGRIAKAVRHRPPQGLVEEVQHQNQELLRALDELERKQQELERLNRELEDTNRGVVALYAELDEKADHLRRADELKSRFLSNMTHEFRSPVNSICGLCNLLIEDAQRDGTPVPELLYIRKAAEQLSELVNDLLDLSKVEAGKTVVRVAPFDVLNLFGTLRGMLRPLLTNKAVALVFEDRPELPTLHTDEGKVSQILRNLISNALKFTEHGEVRVSARTAGDEETIEFSVSDTGIGIAAEDQARIFEEFTQLEHRLQRGVRGTGLGLPLSKRLAELLGGTLTVTSEPGVGSTFTVSLPVRYRSASVTGEPFEWSPEADKLPLLVVDDDPDAQHLLSKLVKGSPYQVYPARTVEEAERALAVVRPAAIVLDLMMSGREGWELLIRFKRDPATAAIPLVAVGSLPDRDPALAAGADAYVPGPADRRRLLDALSTQRARVEVPIRVLVVDDQEVARYLIRQCLPEPEFEITESDTGEDAVRRAADDRPDVIVLDLLMPGMSGPEVIERLRSDPATASIPVVVATASDLQSDAILHLRSVASLLLSKSNISAETLGQAVRSVLRPLKGAGTPDGEGTQRQHAQ